MLFFPRNVQGVPIAGSVHVWQHLFSLLFCLISNQVAYTLLRAL